MMGCLEPSSRQPPFVLACSSLPGWLYLPAYGSLIKELIPVHGHNIWAADPKPDF